MAATLPVGFAAALSFLGLAAPPFVAWTIPLAPIAPLLLVVSVVLLVAGHARCGWHPAGVVAVGGLLLYLAMYVFVVRRL